MVRVLWLKAWIGDFLLLQSEELLVEFWDDLPRLVDLRRLNGLIWKGAEFFGASEGYEYLLDLTT